MRTKDNPGDVNTRDLIGWEAQHQSKTDGREVTDGRESADDQSADSKELTDGLPNKAADGKLKKAADSKFASMKSKLQAGE